MKPKTQQVGIRDMNTAIWQKFTGYCKMSNIPVGQELAEILREYLKKEGIIK